MLTNYYTLRALVREWGSKLSGATLVDAYSQNKGSLILVFQSDDGGINSINLSLRAPVRHLFRYEGSNRARRNVVDHFPRLRSKSLEGLSIAEGDRLVTWQFSEGLSLVMIPFGSAANAVLVDASGEVIDSFRSDAPAAAPTPLKADMPASPEAVERLLSGGKPAARIWPLLSGPLRDELLFRVGGTEDPARLFEMASSMILDLDESSPRIYRDEEGSPTLSLITLRHLEGDDNVSVEKFVTVDEAVRVCARRRLALNRFEGSYKPLLQAIRKRHAQASRSLGRVEKELSQPSRADRYEYIGHLLMAQLHLVEEGSEVVHLPDIMADGSTVTIQLDPKMSAVENAQKMFEKAKSTRASREVAEERLEGLKQQMSQLDALLEDVKHLSDSSEVADFQKKYEGLLSTLQQASSDQEGVPYRRFEIGGGYEVWVGRNAKQNDDLTLRDARPFDLWMHARGVAGSHTVLRVKGRKDNPPKQMIERAAAIAAWYSKSRTSSLAPVIVTQRKYVRKPRKSPAGSVRVEREEVILIEPALPS